MSDVENTQLVVPKVSSDAELEFVNEEISGTYEEYEEGLEEEREVESPKGIKLRPLEMRKGKTAVVYLRLANMAIRGYSTQQIADELGLEEHRVTKLLKENRQIWDYIERHLNATFSEGDRILAHLYKKAMMSLDDELSSSSADVRQKARDQIFDMLKMMGMGRTNDKEGEVHDNRSIIFNQFFGGNKSPISGKINSIDDLILMKRKERGLDTKLITTDRGKNVDKRDEGEVLVDVEENELAGPIEEEKSIREERTDEDAAN